MTAPPRPREGPAAVAAAPGTMPRSQQSRCPAGARRKPRSSPRARTCRTGAGSLRSKRGVRAQSPEAASKHDDGQTRTRYPSRSNRAAYPTLVRAAVVRSISVATPTSLLSLGVRAQTGRAQAPDSGSRVAYSVWDEHCGTARVRPGRRGRIRREGSCGRHPRNAATPCGHAGPRRSQRRARASPCARRPRRRVSVPSLACGAGPRRHRDPAGGRPPARPCNHRGGP